MTIPPLRQRRDDIDAIARAVIELARRRPGDARPTLTEDALVALRDWSWPGNVRELRNTIERAMLVAREGRITASDLGLAAVTADVELQTSREAPSQLPASVEAHERAQILAALEQCDGNKSQAARLLGIARNTLLARMDSWGMRDPKR
ncbi:hypothetical protein BH11MYX3_BH11MYX3_02500 [soil metagenome]